MYIYSEIKTCTSYFLEKLVCCSAQAQFVAENDQDDIKIKENAVVMERADQIKDALTDAVNMFTTELKT